jgi:hypothetical protein
MTALTSGWSPGLTTTALLRRLGLVHPAVSLAVCGVLLASLERYGVPDEILTDNGRVFTGR